jgi:predicted NBD/HSP70 family sugar kinase
MPRSHALRRRCAQPGSRDAGPDEVARLHLAGHPAVLGWIDGSGRLLAPMLVMLENLFDPETIILGGGLPDGVIDALIAAMSPLAVSVSNRSGRSVPRVQRGATGRLTAALGAAALPLLDTMTPKLDRTVLREQDETITAEAE